MGHRRWPTASLRSNKLFQAFQMLHLASHTKLEKLFHNFQARILNHTVTVTVWLAVFLLYAWYEYNVIYRCYNLNRWWFKAVKANETRTDSFCYESFEDASKALIHPILQSVLGFLITWFFKWYNSKPMKSCVAYKCDILCLQ